MLPILITDIATTATERMHSVCRVAEALAWTTTITAQITMNVTWTLINVRKSSALRTPTAKVSTRCAMKLMTTASTAEDVRILDVAPDATILT